MNVFSGQRLRLTTALGAGALSLAVLASAGGSAGASVAVADARDRGWSPIATVGRAPVAVRHAVTDLNLDGEAVALWQDSTRARHLVRAAGLGADGSWGEAVDVAGGFAAPMQVALGDGGQAAAVWVDSEHIWVGSRSAEDDWRQPVRVGPLAGVKNLSADAAVVLDDGTALLGWSRRTWGHERETHVTRLAPDGAVVADEIVNEGYEGGPPSLAVADDGTVTAMWVQRESEGARLVLVSRTWSLTDGWSGVVPVDEVGERYVDLRIVSTRRGGVSAAWLERDRRWLVVVDRTETGYERHLQLRVPRDARLDEIHTFAHAGGRLLLGWSRTNVRTDETRHTLMIRVPAGEWSKQRVVTVARSGSTMSADITLRGRVVATWTVPIDYPRARVRAMERTVRGRWTSAYHFGWGVDPQVDLNAVGDAVVTWRSSRDDEPSYTEVLLSRVRLR